MLKIGLTGGIGSGKTTVAQLFAHWQVPIVDADIIARQIVAPGQPALADIAQHFGSQFILPDGQLNRSLLRSVIFTDPQQKQRLDALLHPRIIASLQQQVQALDARYVIMVVPLLFETGLHTWMDRILVIDCPTAEQIARVVLRDGCTPEQVQAIMATQANPQWRQQQADDVIDNSSACQIALAAQVKTLHNLYRVLAKDKRCVAAS